MTDDKVANLGPLAALAGVWEGEKGADVAPGGDREKDNNAFRERLVLEPIGRVDNHEQTMFGLRYATKAWRIGADEPFHEEVGYWLWDAAHRQVMRSFLVPRGISVIAGGTVAPDATEFSLSAELGSPTYGICSNPFLHSEFKTTRYDVTITVHGPDSFTYDEDTQMLLMGRKDVFHHTDRNTLTRVE